MICSLYMESIYFSVVPHMDFMILSKVCVYVYVSFFKWSILLHKRNGAIFLSSKMCDFSYVEKKLSE